MAAARGCVTLFALPFCIAGLALAGVAVKRAIDGEPATDIALAGVAGLAFGAAGFGLMFAARTDARKAAEWERRRAEHADRPWMWDPEWATGTLRSSERNIAVAAWIFALIWNAISAPVLFILPEELESGNTLALIGLIFPLVGAGIIVWAIRATLRRRRFGASVLRLAKLPAVPGHTLEARLTARLDPPPASMRVQLACVRRIHGSEDTTERLLWQDAYDVQGEVMSREAGGTVVPIVFDIPADAEPTDREARPNEVAWRLTATASVPGVDYAASFAIPVFQAGEPVPLPASSASSRATTRAAVRAPFDPADATVQVAPGPGGGTEFRFGAARSPGAALAVTIVAAIVVGAAFGVRALGAPTLFVVVCGVLGVLLALIAIDLWFATTTVEVLHDEINVRHSVLGIGRTRRMNIADIADVCTSIGMTQNQSATQSSRVWYDIAIVPHAGRKLTAGRHVASRGEAEWLVAQLKEVLRLESRTTRSRPTTP